MDKQKLLQILDLELTTVRALRLSEDRDLRRAAWDREEQLEEEIKILKNDIETAQQG